MSRSFPLHGHRCESEGRQRATVSLGIFSSAPRCYIQRMEPPLYSGLAERSPAKLGKRVPIHWRSISVGFAAGVVSVVMLVVAIFVSPDWFTSKEVLQERKEQSHKELLVEREGIYNEGLNRSASDCERLVDAVHAILQVDPTYTIDFLILSGGGDKGAFASGFLRGWFSVAAGPLARPKFVGVSGVSAGALIAPSAFLGTVEDARVIDEIFRSTDPDWVVRRGLLFFNLQHSSLAEIPGLEREVHDYIDLPYAQRLIKAGASGRALIFQATNADHGTAHSFDGVALARQAVSTGDLEPLRDALLASSAIPGIFPPQLMDDELYIDGILTGNIFYGDYTARSINAETFGSLWKRRYPNTPIAKMRYWVIINSTIKPSVLTVQPRWISLAKRGLEVASHSFTAVTLRNLFLLAENARLRGEGEHEVRWVAVPSTWDPPVGDYFNQESMRSLSDLGRRMGEDPNSWNTQPP